MERGEKTDRLGYYHLRNHPKDFGGPLCVQKRQKGHVPEYALQDLLGHYETIWGPLERLTVREGKEVWRLTEWAQVQEGHVVRLVSCEKAKCIVTDCAYGDRRHLPGYMVTKTVNMSSGPQVILVRPAEEVAREAKV